ncbi:hypothetical protein [Paraburkholderia youngii]|uniref:hypothetical protein n=1 Tax=Paraburkholderia youngii TaxID=2782701 RepID=UPI003D198516
MQNENIYASDETAEKHGVVWAFDSASGWERDADVVWIVDEGNAEQWEEGVTYWTPTLH